MQGEATTTAAEARPLGPIRYQAALSAQSAPRASGTTRAQLAVEDARLRDAVRALLSAIDALP